MLRTQESSNFIKFLEVVQHTAEMDDSVFFLECEDGNDAEIDGMSVSDLQGWLIPQDKVEEFLPIWENDEVDDEWIDFFVFVNWKNDNGLKIEFVK